MQRRKFFLGLGATCAAIPTLAATAQQPSGQKADPIFDTHWFAIAYFYKEGVPDRVVQTSGGCDSPEEAMQTAYLTGSTDGYYLYSVDIYPTTSDTDCTASIILPSLNRSGTKNSNPVWKRDDKWELETHRYANGQGRKKSKVKKRKNETQTFAMLKKHVKDEVDAISTDDIVRSMHVRITHP